MKFSTAGYTKCELENDEVIVFGKGPSLQRADNDAGVARFGGEWRAPNYQKAYLRAARVLIAQAQGSNDLDQLALPIFYLLRHAVELFIKGWLKMLYDIELWRQDGAATRSAIEKNSLVRLADSHNLTMLCSDFYAAVTRLGYGELIDGSLKCLTEALQCHEVDPTWSRYPTSLSSRQSSGSEDEVVLPIVELHARMESILQALEVDFVNDSSTLGGEIYFEWSALAQQRNS